MEAFEVTLDGTPHRFFLGATVRDLAGRLGPEDRVAIENGLATITDSHGNALGSGGALRPQGRYLLVRTV
ncbi:MAG TPA: hypothetical protein V6D00_05310 [Pantanalinema sp.]